MNNKDIEKLVYKWFRGQNMGSVVIELIGLMKIVRKIAYQDAAKIADKLCLDAMECLWCIDHHPDLIGNRLREKADEE